MAGCLALLWLAGNCCGEPPATAIEGSVTNGAASGPKTNALPALPPLVFPKEFTAEDRSLVTQGQQVYRGLCFACHGLDGRGTPLTSGPPGGTMAPSLVGARIATGWRDGAVNVLLKGLNGPVDGKTYSAVMAPEQFNPDIWIASVLSYVRTQFGNQAPLVTTNEVAAVRDYFTNRETPWTMPELEATLPPLLPMSEHWKVKASSNSRLAQRAMETNATSQYTSRGMQQAGDWFQIELPEAAMVSGLQFNAGALTNDFPRGYGVRLSLEGSHWDAAVAAGRGTGSQTEISFAATKAKFIRIELTTNAAARWSIHNLRVLGPPPPPPALSDEPKPEPSKYD